MEITRRSFLATAPVAAAGCALAGAPVAMADQPSPVPWQTTVYEDAALPASATEEYACDIAIVGTGIAGMSAAVEAAEAGASVIVLEKRDITGGDSSICSGNYYCCGSQKQDSMGYTEYGTAEEIAQFYFDQSDGDANMDICRLVAEKGGEGMDWLVAHGCDFDKKPGNNVSDRSMLSTNGGMGIVDALVAAAETAGAQVMMETRAVEVLTDGGAVNGLVARRGDVEVRIAAGAVVLATGGFDGQDWSKEMYAKGAVGWHTFSSPANTGDGIELAKQAGALTVLKGGLSQIHLVGREPLMLNAPQSQLRMVNTGIYVSDLGYRCANESMTSQFDYFVPFVKSGRKEFTIICDCQQPEERLALIEEAVDPRGARRGVGAPGVPPPEDRRALQRALRHGRGPRLRQEARGPSEGRGAALLRHPDHAQHQRLLRCPAHQHEGRGPRRRSQPRPWPLFGRHPRQRRDVLPALRGLRRLSVHGYRDWPCRRPVRHGVPGAVEHLGLELCREQI